MVAWLRSNLVWELKMIKQFYLRWMNFNLYEYTSFIVWSSSVKFSDISYNWKVILCFEIIHILWDDFFPREFNDVRSFNAQIYVCFHLTSKNLLLAIFRKLARLKKSDFFQCKCFSGHQFPAENFFLVDFEGSQNK